MKMEWFFEPNITQKNLVKQKYQEPTYTKSSPRKSKVHKIIKSKEKFSHTGKNLQISYEMFNWGRKHILTDVTNHRP